MTTMMLSSRYLCLPSSCRAAGAMASSSSSSRALGLTGTPVFRISCGAIGVFNNNSSSNVRCARLLSSITTGGSSGGGGDSSGGGGGGGGGDSGSNNLAEQQPKNQQQQHKQPFVQAHIRAGEWDRARTNPLYRPAYASRARILSAEDFAKRPKVGMSITFDNLQDAMVTLTWMNQDTWQELYDLYLDLMQSSYERFSTTKSNSKDGGGDAGTSHEYILRLLAQKYKITPERAAGIVLLKHREEQYKHAGHELMTDIADYMDQTIQQEIDWAYETFEQPKPTDVPFIEDPVGADGHVESKQFTAIDDVLDFAQLEQETKRRLERETQQAMDGYTYRVDKDPTTISVPVDSNCRQLMAAQKKLSEESMEFTSLQELNDSNKKQQHTWPEPHDPHAAEDDTGGEDEEGDSSSTPKQKPTRERRPRWKFVAQTVNTRELKKAQKKHVQRRRHRRRRAYCNNDPTNTLVEQDGVLRVANAAEVGQVAWKPTRKVNEFIYGTVQEAWLEHVLYNRPHAWGKQEAPSKKKEEEDKTATGTDVDDKDDEIALENEEAWDNSDDSNASKDDEDKEKK